MLIYLLACDPGTELVPGTHWTLLDPLPGQEQDEDCMLEFKVYGPQTGMVFDWTEDCGRDDLPVSLASLGHDEWGHAYDVHPGGWWYIRHGREIMSYLWVYGAGQDVDHNNLNARAVVPVVHTSDLQPDLSFDEPPGRE